MELHAEQRGQVGLGMSSPGSIPAGFMKGCVCVCMCAIVPPFLPPSLESADQDSHASLPGIGDYSHERL